MRSDQLQRAQKLLERACALRASGRTREAIDAYSEILEICPRSEIYFERALMFSKCGDISRAVIDLTDAIALNCSDPDLYVNRGNEYLRSKAFDVAIDDYNSALQLSPNNAIALNGRGWALYSIGKYAEGFADLHRSIAIDPGNARPHYNLSALYFKEDQLQEALKYANRAFALMPNDDNIIQLRQWILEEIKESS